MDITLRRVKEAPLTNDELDDNFEYLETRVVSLELSGVEDVNLYDPGDLSLIFTTS